MRMKSLAVESEDENGDPCLEYLVVSEDTTAEQWLNEQEVNIVCICFDPLTAEQVAVAWNAYYGLKN